MNYLFDVYVSRVPELVRLGKAESMSESLLAHHIDSAAERLEQREGTAAAAAGL